MHLSALLLLSFLMLVTLHARPEPPCSACKRVSSLSLSAETLQEMSEPVIITGTLKGANDSDWALWTQAGFLQSVGNVTVEPSLSMFDLGDGDDDITYPAMTYAELFDANLGAPTTLFKSESLPFPTETALRPTGLNRFLSQFGAWSTTTLALQGGWNDMHSHEATLLTQVVGKKGVVLAPGHAFPKGSYAPIGTTEICNQFGIDARLSDVFPEVVPAHGGLGTIRNASHCCELSSGETIFWPEEWYHGTCGLAGWNTAFSVAGRLTKSDL